MRQEVIYYLNLFRTLAGSHYISKTRIERLTNPQEKSLSIVMTFFYTCAGKIIPNSVGK